jgi:hypothetical protein
VISMPEFLSAWCEFPSELSADSICYGLLSRFFVYTKPRAISFHFVPTSRCPISIIEGVQYGSTI